MTNPVSICNIALGFIGANTITTLNEDDASSVEEEMLAPLFEPTVKKILEEKAWLFATGFVDLGAIAATPAGEVERLDLPSRFKLPADTVAVRACDDGSGDYTVLFEKAGGYVVAEPATQLFALLTRYNPDPKAWAPSFVFAVIYKLAHLLAVPLSQNAKLGALYEAEYERELKKASTLDAMQGNTFEKISRKSSSLALKR